MECRIVILNYNGTALLPQCLPSIVAAAKQSRHSSGITVLDNLSTDHALDYVRAQFPDVQIAAARQNAYLCSYNDYLREMKEPVAILLNNDIRVEPDFIDPLLEKFREDPATFLVAPRVMSFDGRSLEAGRSLSGWRLGSFWCDARYRGFEKDANRPSTTFSSGFGAFDRKKFVRLGGYDPLYLPGILEDVDLSLRASRAGFRLYYEPRSVVYHMGQASFKRKFGSRRLTVLAHRNTFLFMWKNFRGPFFWLQHLFFLPLRFLYAAIRGKTALLEGFWQAFRMRGKLKP